MAACISDEFSLNMGKIRTKIDDDLDPPPFLQECFTIGKNGTTSRIWLRSSGYSGNRNYVVDLDLNGFVIALDM